MQRIYSAGVIILLRVIRFLTKEKNARNHRKWHTKGK